MDGKSHVREAVVELRQEERMNQKKEEICQEIPGTAKKIKRNVHVLDDVDLSYVFDNEIENKSIYRVIDKIKEDDSTKPEQSLYLKILSFLFCM